MEYVRATEVLPADIVESLQEYAEGCMIYIPKRPGSRICWGMKSKIKNELAERNHKIRNDYSSGYTLKKLTDKYHLAESTIKKIIYGKSDVKIPPDRGRSPDA